LATAGSFVVAHRGMHLTGDGWPDMNRHKHDRKFALVLTKRHARECRAEEPVGGTALCDADV
jgi:hypothetical protein